MSKQPQMPYCDNQLKKCLVFFIILITFFNQLVEADGCSSRAWFCCRFLPVKKRIIVSAVVYCPQDEDWMRDVSIQAIGFLSWTTFSKLMFVIRQHGHWVVELSVYSCRIASWPRAFLCGLFMLSPWFFLVTQVSSHWTKTCILGQLVTKLSLGMNKVQTTVFCFHKMNAEDRHWSWVSSWHHSSK